MVVTVPTVALAPQVDPLTVGLTIVLVILCLGVHEAAHAWTALKLGDPTGRDLGRITLNPIPHIDPIMTIGIPLLCLLTGAPVFGGAKPVPVNFHRLRNPWFDMAVVSFAGPFSNFILAILFFAMAKFFVATGYYNGAADFAPDRWHDLLPNVLADVAAINVMLFVFNLIPIPPLDGSKVLAQALPESMRESFLRIGFVGLLIIYGLISMSAPFRHFLLSAVDKAMNVVISIATLGGRF